MVCVGVRFCIFSAFATSGSSHPLRNKFVLSGSEDKHLYLWHLQTKQLKQKLCGPPTPRPSYSRSLVEPRDIDGLRLFAHLRLSTASGITVDDGGGSRCGVCRVGHSSPVLAVCCHPSEMIVASGGMAPDNTVKIWKDEREEPS